MKTHITYLMTLALVCLQPSLAQDAGQRTFSDPDEAVKALIAAATSNDTEALTVLVGPKAREIVTTGDPKEDRANNADFVKACKEKFQLVPAGDTLMMLMIGKEAYPVPLPLAKKGEIWYFDGKRGLEEIRARRIGGNELSVIRACEAYKQAQHEYAKLDPDGSGILQYAQRIASHEGKHDGLYWPATNGEVPSPLGPFFSQAGITKADKGKPFYGYRFKILTGQGPHAPGGAYSYIINGHMVAGFGLLAYPAEYGKTGVMTFMMGPAGNIYERDLKDQTEKVAGSLDQFDPGAGWTKI